MQTISVVIPAYNAVDTIVDALNSVVEQTSPVSEIIVVDDASTDNTVQAIEHWTAMHPGRVQLIRQAKNTGPAGARNRGVHAASGTWIAFLDGDDAWLPDRIAHQSAVLEAHPDVALLCGTTVSNTLEKTIQEALDVSRVKPLEIADLVSHNPIATSTVLAKRDALLKAGLFDEQFRGPEDYDLWLRMVVRFHCVLMEAPLAVYRVTPGSLSLDDRTFLPQVRRVLDKAFSSGGALAEHRHFRASAYAEQYTSASWMAFNRGSRWRAVFWLLRSYGRGPVRLYKEKNDPLLRTKLLWRYLTQSVPIRTTGNKL